MFADIVFESDHRRVFNRRHEGSRTPFLDAAHTLLKRDRILIATGFFIPEANACETDGPPGAKALGIALQKLGKQVLYTTDPITCNTLKALGIKNTQICKSTEKPRTEDQLISEFSPDFFVTIERPGAGPNRKYLTIKGKDISNHAGSFERYVSEFPCIAIGDGGNELGFLHPKADHLLWGSTSNWATYGLIAALEAISGHSDLLPQPETARTDIEKAVRAGAVDGISGLQTATVDGYSNNETLAVLGRLKKAIYIFTTARSLVQNFRKEQESKYGFIPITWTLRKPPDQAMAIEVTAVTEAQANELESRFCDQFPEISIQSKILSDPATEGPSINWHSINSLKVDLTNYINGKFTTQILQNEGVCRRVWTEKESSLVQTPDLAMGWCSSNLLTQCNISEHPWKSIIRPIPGKPLFNETLPGKIIESAKSYLDCPYLLGGRTREGLDCSALIQLSFKSAGILFPRNSRMQRKCGTRIPFSKAEPLDLIFAVGKKFRIHHVALQLESELIHACLAEKKVILQSKKDFLKFYKIIAIRRPVRFK